MAFFRTSECLINVFYFQAIACAVEFDDQHCGIYAGDADSYKDFAEVFDPIIQVKLQFFFTRDNGITRSASARYREGDDESRPDTSS